MTAVNYYSISGLNSTVKFGKTGGQLSYDDATHSFNVRQTNTSLYAGFAVSNLDAVTGDINVLQGKINFGNGTTLSLQQSGVLRFDGSGALIIPSGNDSTRPVSALVGMIRINTQSIVSIEYFDGTVWRILGGNSLPLTGGIMTGDITMSNNAKVTGLPTPTLASDAVPKSYVDNLISGLSWKQAVTVYAPNNVNVLGPSSAIIAGVAVSLGDRILLVGQTDNSQNGIWIYNGVGIPMSRASDASTPTQLNGAAVFILRGDRQDTGWTQASLLTTSFAGQVWVQFTGGAAYTAGTGLTLTGNQFSVNLGPGLAITGAGNGVITVSTQLGNAIQLSEAGEVILKLETSGGLLQGVDGLKIADGQVTNSMLAGQIETSKLVSNYITVSDGTAIDEIDLGETLTVQGTDSIVTEVTQGVVTIGAATATTSTRGVASFDSTNFNVNNGAVSVNIIDAGLF